MRNRIRMIASATLLVAVFSVTMASAAPRAGGSGAPAAQGTQLAITPIQRLSLSLGKEPVNQGNQQGSTETVARVGDKVGQVPGFCRLHS